MAIPVASHSDGGHNGGDVPDDKTGSQRFPKLYIHIDDSNPVTAPPKNSSSSPSLSPTSSTAPTTADDTHDAIQPLTPTTPTVRTPRVHFRSRVRIASGLSHAHSSTNHNHSPPSSKDRTPNHPFSTPTSSRSSSPSSSIYAPLKQSHSDGAHANPLWAPLGQRVRLLAWRNTHSSLDRSPARFVPHSERTPLIKTVLRPAANGYGASTHSGQDWRSDLFTWDHDGRDEDDDRTRLNREIDWFFGPWPGRLLNRHVSSLFALRISAVMILIP